MASPTIYVPKSLIPATQLAAANATLYTSPAGQDGTRLTALLLINDTTTAATVTLYHVPSGDAAGDDNIICKAITVPGDGWPIALPVGGVILDASDTLEGFASAATQITILLYGIEMD